VLFTLVALLCALANSGCRVPSYGTGGTGEWVVPQDTLHRIDGLDLQAVATTQPATRPSTQPYLPTTLPSTQPVSQIELTIEEVRQSALQNNLDIRVDLFDPTIARESVLVEQGQFESVFTTNVDYARLDQATFSTIEGTQIKDLNLAPGVRIPMLVGGTIALSAPMNWTETNSPSSINSTIYSSTPTATLNLPLLRGFGIDANAVGVRVAFYESQSSQARTKADIIRILAESERAYWRLYQARRALDVRRKEYELAIAQLERARRLVRAEKASEVEIIRAESGAADTLETIITAENALRDQQRIVKQLINRPGLELDSPTVVIPVTIPDATPYALEPHELVNEAMDRRMELLETELQIAAETANIKANRNATLPLVSLQYQYNVNGLDTGFDGSWDVVRSANFQDHRVGLQIEIPLGNQSAHARLRQSIARRLQQLATREQRRQAIAQEVLTALDTLQTNYQRILAARQRVVLAQRTLQAETRQFELGLRTSTDVLDAQTRLANAALAEISAVTDYQISQIDVAFATGTLLGSSHIYWEAVRSSKE
jgi:outer membrane protein TolC